VSVSSGSFTLTFDSSYTDEYGQSQAIDIKNVVFGVGNRNADLLIIGEAPGAQEDKQGEPFVGPAGQLLTKMLKAINLHREDVYIANILKCRPPNNRDPKPD
jgi:DNA polymerase